MKELLKTITANPRTSIAGAAAVVAGVSVLIHAIQHNDVTQIATAIGMIAGGGVGLGASDAGKH